MTETRRFFAVATVAASLDWSTPVCTGKRYAASIHVDWKVRRCVLALHVGCEPLLAAWFARHFFAILDVATVCQWASDSASNRQTRTMTGLNDVEAATRSHR